MQKILVVAFLGIFFLSFSSLAKDADKTNPPATKELMQQLLAQMTALKPYFISEQKFVDPTNNETIASHLKELARLAKETHHDPALAKENFKFSRQVLEEHIIDTERVFRLGNKAYARWQLASTLSVCTSCHSQMPGPSHTQSGFNDIKAFSWGFEQAEFLFATRDFEQAFFLFDKVIDGYPKNKAKSEEVERSLERQLAYLTRVQRDPQRALEKLRTHQKNDRLPEYMQINIRAWISQLEIWKKQNILDPKKASEKQMMDFAKKNINDEWTKEMLDATHPQLVSRLIISGLLYEYLNSHPHSKIVPNVLYWLALCDRSINQNFFFSLADLYLRECMQKYPANAVAKKCYEEYERETILGYTGSYGTELPADVKEELISLKKYVDQGGKIKNPGKK